MRNVKKLPFLTDRNGTVAAEFALVLIPFLALVFGTFGLSFMLWANTTLHFAVEDAARCYSVKKTVCADQASTRAYALSHYKGPNVSPVFTASPNGCGHTVVGTGTFPLNAVVVNLSIPLSATACFP